MKKTAYPFTVLLVVLGISFPAVLRAQMPVSPCPEVLIEQKYDHIGSPQYHAQGWDTVVTFNNPSIELSAEPYIPVQYFNGTYTVESIPYNPPDTSFWLKGEGSMMPITSDDNFAASPTNIPFPFYFFGIQKTQFRVGDNGLVTFTNTPMTDMHYSGPFCPYNVNNPIPWTQSAGTNPGGLTYFDRTHDAVYGVYEDTYFGSSGSYLTGNQGVYYGIVDNYPCRKIICTWDQIPIYVDATKRQSYQIVCYEGTNIIEVHVKMRYAKPATSQGLIGIQNATGLPQVTGTIGEPNMYVVNDSPASFAAPGWNLQTATTGAVSNVAFRFTPMGMTQKSYSWYRIFDDGRDSVMLGTDQNDTNGYYIPMNSSDPDHPTLTKAVVHPNCVSRYVMRLNFKNANNDWYYLYDTITVGVDKTLYQVDALSSDSTMGKAVGSGSYPNGDTATLYALPRQGYSFQGWSDGAVDNPYDLTVASDTTVTAFFSTCTDTVWVHDTIYITLDGIDGVDAMNVKVYQSEGQVVVEGAENNTVALYDIMGRRLTAAPMGSTSYTDGRRVRFDVPTTGVYLVKIGNLPARRIVVVK
ncbi:MAG: hypothetical protein IKR33_04700 [Bacteroidales bacterium]|nr:hypothetical protein [Bacteroidales bacterium]